MGLTGMTMTMPPWRMWRDRTTMQITTEGEVAALVPMPRAAIYVRRARRPEKVARTEGERRYCFHGALCIILQPVCS
jgi:hypothetical protein